MIQSQNVDPDHGLKKDYLHKVREIDVKKLSIINPGDVIIKTKTANPFSFMIKDSNKKFAVTYDFMIIRINDRSIDPRYLNWYLNSKRGRSNLIKMMSGTNVPFMSKKTLMNIDIPVPDSKTQKRIVGLNCLLRKENDLTIRILELKRELAEQLSHNAMKGG